MHEDDRTTRRHHQRIRTQVLLLSRTRRTAPVAATTEAGMAERRAQADTIVAHHAMAGLRPCTKCVGTGRARADIRVDGNILTYSDRGECQACLGTGREPVRIAVGGGSERAVNLRVAVAQHHQPDQHRAMMIWGGTRSRRAANEMAEGLVG